ncbi:MAG: cytochrome-c oxidase, cbb3-type subunit I [Planctomycetales bacterium]|nr:cytochrome-c oxidase, cbb3-type subunit I [Planctomycetales bacterium]
MSQTEALAGSDDASKLDIANPAGVGKDGNLEEFTYDDGIVRLFVAATVLWALVGTLAGVYVALMLVVPQASFGLDFLTFGRLRPLHTNAAIFAFAGNAIFAAVYYSTQRLCKCRMYSDLLSRLHFWGWQLIIVLAALTIPLGFSQGKEYAELPWPVDLLIAVVWLVIFGGNFLMTLLHRRERHLYVALWFYIATIVTVAVLHVFNNLVVPTGILTSYPIYAGVQDAFMQWWYGHNAVAFFLTTPFLGLMYYFLPKAADRPVFSYRLSIIHFWSLVFIYIWAGPHHLHYSAVPDWMSTLGMIFSVMLWMPSWGGMINGLLTLRGAWKKVADDPILKFFVVGITFYGMSTFEGPLLSIKSVNKLSHFTDWTIAHVHSGALGWNGFMAFGMLYWLAPRVFQTPLWSKSWASTHFWTGTLAILLYIIPIYWAGITQGLMWSAINPENGALEYPNWIETTRVLQIPYIIRICAGLLYVGGVVMMMVNLIMTWAARPAVYEVPVHRAAPLRGGFHDPVPPKSQLDGVLEIGKKVDVWSKAFWHRRLERLPVRLTLWVTASVLLASAFEMVPTFLIRSNVPTIASVKPYTPLELYGRDIYVAEGCYNCHSQMIRPLLADKKRFGDYSRAGEFVYDRPFQWGSRRIGPDLARVGGRQSHLWHVTHFRDPASQVEGSIMPAYAWLEQETINFADVQPRVRAASFLGAEYSDEIMNNPAADAERQAREIAEEIARQDGPEGLHDKKVVALIAYLQRLGTDIYNTEEPAAEAEEPTSETEPEAESTAATESNETPDGAGTESTASGATTDRSSSDEETLATPR